MKLRFSQEALKACIKAGCKSRAITKNEDAWQGHVEVDSAHVDVADYPIIQQVVQRPEFKAHIDHRRIYRKLEAIAALKAGGAKHDKVRSLEVLAEAIKELVRATPHKWLFAEHSAYGVALPYFCTNVYYEPFDYEHNTPAHTDLRMEAMVRGSARSNCHTFHKEDLRGTVAEILGAAGYTLEVGPLVEGYTADMAAYKAAAPQTGAQYTAQGSGVVGTGWRSGTTPFERLGVPAKVVMDDTVDWAEDKRHDKEDSGFRTTAFWTGGKQHGTEDEESGGETYELPVHPVVRVFNLGTHEYVDTHIQNLAPYVYDAGVINKLVLPAEHKALVDVLVQGAAGQLEDIIKGKASGVVILCSGKPGTGKTLTAEVYSEAAKRPLYMVQCSQLGTDPESLEKHLREVLDRATRWQAILLIDEADVYIHERGADVGQNAIVGVFLRLLEYYNGILFMNTNRVTVVDDAILSRATAHVKYDTPKGKALEQVWGVLAAQYGIKFTVKQLDEVLGSYPIISGRSIRQLLRLAKTMALAQGKEVTPAMVKWAAQFHDFTEIDPEA